MDVREALGYSHSTRFYGPERVNDLPANELAFALRVASIECPKLGSSPDQVRFDGVYVLQRAAQAPAVPVVLVVQVNTETDARRVHQFVWNQNQAPFLIVESPSTIRIYPGFAFDRARDTPLFAPVLKSAADALTILAAFRAESIDDGTLWSKWAHAVDPSKRVDEALLRDLEALDGRLQHHGVDRTTSHGLIGKFVYLRYLRDRDILSDKKLEKWGINPEHLFTRRATLKAFHKVNDELQQWLNGSVFSVGEVDLNTITAAQLQLVAGVFRGESPVGTDQVQTNLFDAYDFAHIPIETLSCVYEQFLHDAKGEDGRSRGKTLGAYYTPLPLADYVLSELNHRRPLEPGMKVLDPACGSGSFLVQSFRRLIERQRRTKGRELKKGELRDLLTESIFGIDRDDDACRVAELSLIMTLLDYVEPPDLENGNFKLPCLRDKNIFQGDFFDETGLVHDLLAKQRFNWIVGNPPWAEVKGTPPADHEHFVAHKWMTVQAKTHPTSGNQIAEAFLWKAGEHLTPDGVSGLVVLAMTWFKKEAIAFRQRFFSERRVWCLANFANLAYVLFAGRSERPASVVFFESEIPDTDHVIVTFAPFVAEQVANRPERAARRQFTWNIVVSGSDVREIRNAAAASGDSLTWKLAMWGTARDRKLLERVAGRFEPFDAFALAHGLFHNEGPRLRSDERTYSKPLAPCVELVAKNKLLTTPLRGLRHIFAFPEKAIARISKREANLPEGEGPTTVRVCRPPLVSVDAARRFAVYSDEYLATPAPSIGIAGEANSRSILRALSLYLSSDYCVYDQFFRSKQWGVDASRGELTALRELPVPIGLIRDAELASWSELHSQLVASTIRRFNAGINSNADVAEHAELVKELNSRVFSLLELRISERWLIEDFVRLFLDLNKGKLTRDTLRPPTTEERNAYLVALRDCLDTFLSTDRALRHKIEMVADREAAVLSVLLVHSKVAIGPADHSADEAASRSLRTIRDRVRTKHSQWIYFDRGLKVYERDSGVLYQFKPMRRLHWTRRQAVFDADDIIAETLVEGGMS